MLDFSWSSFAFAVVNFLILAALLYRFLHKPLLAMLDQRKLRVEDARKESEQKTKEAAEALAKYERETAAIGEERDKALSEARKSAQAARDELLANAREEAEKEVANHKRDWERQRRDALEALQDEIVGVSLAMAGRVVKELSDADLEAKVDARLTKRLDELAADEVARKGLFEGQAPVRVVSAKALDDGQRRQVSERVRALADGDVEIDFGADESLIMGSRVEFSSMAVDASLAAILAEARERFEQTAEEQAGEAEDEQSSEESEVS